MKSVTISFLSLISFSLCLASAANPKDKQLLIPPFENKVFIEEHGQFNQCEREREISFPEPVLYGVENAEFNVYFMAHGISFLFPERKKIGTEDDDCR